jgi:hypothetical protein
MARKLSQEQLMIRESLKRRKAEAKAARRGKLVFFKQQDAIHAQKQREIVAEQKRKDKEIKRQARAIIAQRQREQRAFERQQESVIKKALIQQRAKQKRAARSRKKDIKLFKVKVLRKLW